MSYTVLINHNAEAQLSENRLESIVNQTNLSTSAQISVGDGPSSISGIGDAVYVANYGSNTVSVIDPVTNTVTENIPVGNGPSSIVATTNAVYVSNSKSNTVSVIDPVTNTVTENIPVGNGPSSIVADTYGAVVYVANFESGTVSVIDPITNTVTKNITVGSGPSSISIAEPGRLYVANYGSISEIYPYANSVREISVESHPVSIENYLGDVYVAYNYESNTVSVIDPLRNTVIENITTVGDSPVDIYTYWLGVEHFSPGLQL